MTYLTGVELAELKALKGARHREDDAPLMVVDGHGTLFCPRPSHPYTLDMAMVAACAQLRRAA